MLKKEIETKLHEYKEILLEIGRWVNPQQYDLDTEATKGRLLFHLNNIKKTLDEKFYKINM